MWRLTFVHFLCVTAPARHDDPTTWRTATVAAVAVVLTAATAAHSKFTLKVHTQVDRSGVERGGDIDTPVALSNVRLSPDGGSCWPPDP